MSHLTKLPSFFLLVCLLVLPQISETIYTPSLPDLAQDLGVQMSQAEFTLSIYFIGFALGVFVFGILSDILGRRKSMLLGLLVYVLGTLGCSRSPSIELLLFFRLIQAFGASVGSVVTLTILRDVYTGTERNRAFSMASGALAFSPAVGPFVGGVIDELFQWRANFYVLVGMGVLMGLFCLVHLPETRKKNLTPPKLEAYPFYHLFKRMICDPKVLSAVFFIGACNGIIFSYYAEAPFIFIEIMGLSPSQYGLLGLLLALSFFVASLLSLRLNRSFAPEISIWVGTGVACLGTILLTLVCTFCSLSSDQSVSVWIGLLFSISLLFIGIGTIIPNTLSQALVAYQDRSGTAGSIFGFLYYLLIAGFITLMGLFHNGTAVAMPLYFTVLSVAMFALSVKNLAKYHATVGRSVQISRLFS